MLRLRKQHQTLPFLLSVLLLVSYSNNLMAMGVFGNTEKKQDMRQSESVGSTTSSSSDDYFVVDHGTGYSGSGIGTGISSLRNTFKSILVIVLGICALISLVGAVMTLMQGDQSAAKRMLLWLLGFSVGAVLIGVLGGISVPATASGDFGGVKSDIKSVISVLLSIVCMVSAVTSAYHVMKGERDGTEKMLRTLVISAVGVILIGLV